MAAGKDISTPRITYGFAGATYPTLKFAVDMARIEYNRLQDHYHGRIKERFDQALKAEENSVYLELHLREG